MNSPLQQIGNVPVLCELLILKVCIINNDSYLCSTRTRQASQRCSNVRVVFLFIGYMATRIPFTKRYSSPCELVYLLKSRGLEVSDEEKAKHYLSHIGYYRLFGKFPEIDLAALGFPVGWEQEPLWMQANR